MMIDLLLPIILVGLVFVFIFYKIGKRNGLNQQIKQTQLSNDKILEERKILQEEIKKEQCRIQEIESEYQSKKQLISDAKEAAEREYAERRDNLNNQHNTRYKELQNIFQEKQIQLQAEYDTKKSELDEQMESLRAELDTLQRQKAAVVEAKQKELALKEKADLYRLNISQTELQDIQLLRSIQFRLTNSRILCMLIWQTFYQPLAKKKFPIILGKKDVCGIYKITNMKNDKVYIGQAVDIYKRWYEHCKAGLGIDTPQGNKLYAAMLEDGLENFTFELLEECPHEELNKKEAYYISLYNSVQYGYNSTKGNING
jgi:hypothetical protein